MPGETRTVREYPPPFRGVAEAGAEWAREALHLGGLPRDESGGAVAVTAATSVAAAATAAAAVAAAAVAVAAVALPSAAAAPSSVQPTPTQQLPSPGQPLIGCPTEKNFKERKEKPEPNSTTHTLKAGAPKRRA